MSRLLPLFLAALALCLPGAALAGGAQPAPAPAPAATAPKAKAPRPQSRPHWAALAPAQQQALQPLQGTWPTLSAARKRKWLVVAEGFADLAPADQARLHARMAEWAAMTPRQRARARLNFSRAQRLPADERRARWEAYQALPEEERRRLAASAPPPAPPTAAAVQPPATLPPPAAIHAPTAP